MPVREPMHSEEPNQPAAASRGTKASRLPHTYICTAKKVSPKRYRQRRTKDHREFPDGVGHHLRKARQNAARVRAPPAALHAAGYMPSIS